MTDARGCGAATLQFIQHGTPNFLFTPREYGDTLADCYFVVRGQGRRNKPFTPSMNTYPIKGSRLSIVISTGKGGQTNGPAERLMRSGIRLI